MEISVLLKLILLFVAFGASRSALMNQTLSNVKNIAALTCSLEATLPDLRGTIRSLFVNGNLMIRFSISINNSGTLEDNSHIHGTMYRPEEWFLIKERKGKHILMLPEDFIGRSLGTLSFSVASLQLVLNQAPHNCFDGLDINQIKSVIRLFLLSNLSKESFAVPEKYEICNREIYKKEVKYQCCSVYNDSVKSGQIECKVLVESEWIKYFYAFQQGIMIIAIVLCPLLIPLSIFQDDEPVSYSCFFFDDEMPLTIKATYKSGEGTSQTENAIPIPLSIKSDAKDDTEDFTVGSQYEFEVENYTIKTKYKKLIQEGSSQFGFSRTLWNVIVRLSCLSKYKGNKQKCRKFCTRIIILCLILFPHLIIISFYNFYDEPIIKYDKQFAAAHKIEIPTSPYISNPYIIGPQDEIIIYVFVFIGYCYLEYTESKVLPVSQKCIASAKLSVADEMKKCKDNIYTINETLEGMNTIVYYVGFISLCIGYIFLFIVRTIPLAKLVVEFPNKLIDIFRGQAANEANSVKLLLVAWLPCSVIFVVHYIRICTFYYISFIAFALIGFLVNYDNVFQYVCLVVLIVVYGVACFSTVNRKYCKFNKILGRNIQERLHEYMQIVACISESKVKDIKKCNEGNVAIALPRKTNTGDEQSKYMHNKISIDLQRMNDIRNYSTKFHLKKGMMVNIPRLILFINNNSDHIETSVPAKFFNEMTTFRHSNCPGSLTALYFKAAKDFVIVVIFLVFVILITFAVGEAYNLTSGVQTLVGLGSGYLPFLLKHFLSRSQSSKLGESKDLFWKALLDYKIDLFENEWLIERMNILYKQKVEDDMVNIVFFKEGNDYKFYYETQSNTNERQETAGGNESANQTNCNENNENESETKRGSNLNSSPWVRCFDRLFKKSQGPYTEFQNQV